MRILRLIIFCTMIALGPTLLGCGGGGAKVQTSNTTLGQELIDLEAAYKKGLITKKQYEEQRKKLLKKKY